jgi:hypothetical protein
MAAERHGETEVAAVDGRLAAELALVADPHIHWAKVPADTDAGNEGSRVLSRRGMPMAGTDRKPTANSEFDKRRPPNSGIYRFARFARQQRLASRRERLCRLDGGARSHARTALRLLSPVFPQIIRWATAIKPDFRSRSVLSFPEDS